MVAFLTGYIFPPPVRRLKIDRHGRAKILSQVELQRLFNDGFAKPRDRALFAVCLYTAARIGEAVSLRTQDVYDSKGNIRPELNIRKGSTKGKGRKPDTVPVPDAPLDAPASHPPNNPDPSNLDPLPARGRCQRRRGCHPSRWRLRGGSCLPRGL